MGRTIGKLAALTVARARKPGLYSDGGGLYLQVGAGGARSWLYRYMLNGRQREMGLGSLTAISLAQARGLATAARHLRATGVDPIEARRAEREKAQLEAARAVTFKQCAATFVEAHGPAWKNPKHRQQWANTLKTYVEPVFGAISVQDVDTALVMKAIEPIWTSKPETAGRLRGRVESILDWAKAKGLRTGENPARWRGHLENLLPATSKLRKVRHHPALPYRDIADFLAELRAQEGVAARALEFLILTATRTSEVVLAAPDHIDAAGKIWIVPAEHMKMGREHRVPLTTRAIEVALEMKAFGKRAYLFPGGRKNKPLSENAMLALLKRMGRDDITAHGFRSTFRDWASEETDFPNHVVEMALAHAIDNKVEAAYRRGDLFEKRSELMEAWSRYAMSSRPSATTPLLTPAKKREGRPRGEKRR